MKELLDRVRINELYARYNWSVDNSDDEAFARTFREDGAFIGTIGSFEGREKLREFARKQDLKSRGLQHWNANTILEFQDERTVHGKTYMLALCQTEKGPMVERAGFYSDVVTKEGDEWLFLTRRFVPLPGTAPLQAPS